MIDRAIALAPDPRLRVTPARIGLTGLDTYFWSSTLAPISATAQAGAVTVTAVAEPAQFVWSFGDGGDRVTYGPGRRWTPDRRGTISHVYETKGLYDLSLELVWEARWRIGAGPWAHLGYFATGSSRSYPVRQMIAMLIPVR